MDKAIIPQYATLKKMLESLYAYNSAFSKKSLKEILDACLEDKEALKKIAASTESYYVNEPYLMLMLIEFYEKEPEKFTALARIFYGEKYLSFLDVNDTKLVHDEIGLYSLGTARKASETEKEYIKIAEHPEKIKPFYDSLNKFEDAFDAPIATHPIFNETGQLFVKQILFFAQLSLININKNAKTEKESYAQTCYVVPPRKYEDKVACIESLLKINSLVTAFDRNHLHIKPGTTYVYVSPLLNQLVKNSGNSWQELQKKLKPYSINDMQSIADTVNEFSRLVILPKMAQIFDQSYPELLSTNPESAYLRNGHGGFYELRTQILTELLPNLKLSLFNTLFMDQKVKVGSTEQIQAGRNITTILDLSKRWHDRHLADLMKDEEFQKEDQTWHPLISPVESKITEGEYKGWKIINLLNTYALDEQHEMKNMGTCINSFEDDCLDGAQHIVLFKDPTGQSRAYVRVTFNKSDYEKGKGFGKKGLEVTFRGRQINSQDPDQESTKVLEVFEEQIANNIITINTEPHGCTAPELRRIRSSLEDKIGYNYNDNEKRQEVFDAFCCKPGNKFGDALKVGKDQTFVKLPKHLANQMSVDNYLAQSGLLDVIYDLMQKAGVKVNRSITNLSLSKQL